MEPPPDAPDHQCLDGDRPGGGRQEGEYTTATDLDPLQAGTVLNCRLIYFRF